MVCPSPTVTPHISSMAVGPVGSSVYLDRHEALSVIKKKCTTLIKDNPDLSFGPRPHYK